MARYTCRFCGGVLVTDRALAALDQAVAAASLVYSENVLYGLPSGPLVPATASSPKHVQIPSPPKAVQIPWDEWTRLVEAVRTTCDDSPKEV
jgi:hypothetical protein